MKAFQLHYTSCRRGRSGSAGFQIRAVTEGIAPDEEREIERRGLYRPPRDARTEPSDDEIEAFFPKAFRYGELDTGRKVLTMSCYTGRDYSGRWGNFFAHSLVFDHNPVPGRDRPCWPIDLYEWDGWQTGLPPEQDDGAPPPMLPEADLGDIKPAESFSFSEIAVFVEEEPARRQALAQMIRSVLAGEESARSLVIRDSFTNGLFWVACVTKLFPIDLAREISFSTYQYDPRGCALVNATTGETDFRFDDTERGFQFYEFDFVTGIHSEVPPGEDDYASSVVEWLLQHDGGIERFFEFLMLFEGVDRNRADLDAASCLFRLQCGEKPELSSDSLARMISFAARTATAQGQVRVIELFGALVDQMQDLDTPDDLAAVVRLLSEGSAITGRSEHRAAACRAWLALLDTQVIARGCAHEQARESWQLVMQAFAGHERELEHVMFTQATWRRLVARLQGAPPETAVLVLACARDALRLVDRKPTGDQPEVASLVAAVLAGATDLARKASSLLHPFRDEAAELAAMVRTILRSTLSNGVLPATEKVSNEVGRALWRVLAGGSRADSALARNLRSLLDRNPTRQVLFGEWLAMVAAATDPREAHAWYRREVLDALPEYADLHASQVAAALLDRLDTAEATRQAIDWAREGAVAGFEPELQRRCLDLMNRAVTFDPRSRTGDEIAALVRDQARLLGLELAGDRVLLRRLVTVVASGGSCASDQLDCARQAVSGIEGTAYRDFIGRFLVAALQRCANRGEHAKVLLAVVRDDETDALRKEYRAFFRGQKKGRWSEALRAALIHWLTFDPSDRLHAGLSSLDREARDELVRVLASLSDRRLVALDKDLDRPDRLTPSQQSIWKHLKRRANDRKQGVWQRMKRRLFGPGSEDHSADRKGGKHHGGR